MHMSPTLNTFLYSPEKPHSYPHIPDQKLGHVVDHKPIQTGIKA